MKAHAMAAKSPEKKDKKTKATPYQGETIVDMEGNITKEPNYKQIRLSKDQQTEVFTKVEEMWAGFLPSEDATTMSKDEAADLLKNVAERTDINEEVFTEIFTDQETGEPLSEVAKEQMHSICQVYMLFLEKQRAREVFEAKKEMVEF